MIAIVDYGMGNLRSVHKAFEKAGFPALVTQSVEELRKADGLVVPGVGAFKKAMENLENLNLIKPIVEFIEKGKPFLGICLGLQLLFAGSEEFGWQQGLSIFPGRVVRFREANLKIPHIGWNTIRIKKPVPIFEGLADGAYFYFVHSYYPIFNGYLDFKNVPEKKEVNIKKLWKNNVIILTNIENRNRVELCYQLKDLLEQNDFKVELKIVDFDQFNEFLENGDFNLAICGLKLDYFIDFNSIKEIFGNYLSNMWIYADVDKTEKDKLFENINNINQKMADYMPFIGLGFRKGEIIYDKRISLPITPYFTSPLNNAELWKVISQ